jgi:two-component system sensor kinase FixL
LGYRELKRPSASILGTSQLANPKYWMIGIAFLAVYLTLNTLTRWYQYNELGITLWSPDDGLSLLLLIEGTAFAPFVLVGEVLADVFINRVNHSLYATVAAEFALTLGYVALASFLRDRLRFDPRRADFANVIKLLLVVPLATTLTSLAYCGSLRLTGSLPSEEFFSAMRHFWIGDTVGMIVIIPTATAVFIFLSKERWRWSSYDMVSCAGFVVGTCLAFAALIRVGRVKDHDLFYLLFLPVIWMGMRLGYAGVAIALLVIQIVLFLTAAHFAVEWDDFDVLQLLALVLSITGLVLGAVVTEREQASRLLREQRAELARVSAYATAGAMGMMLAHEVSQPLSTVAAYLHAARRMLQSAATVGPAMEALSKAELETRRTREVLERVRDFVSTGKLELAPLDVLDIALKIRALCKEEANARNVYVEVEGIRPIPLVAADRVGIEQVLYNVVANAIDAAAERRDAHGIVIIHVAGRDDRVVVQIDDNGPGVAPEIAERLFEAYQTTKPRGMGLGLPLSLQIVKMHEGRLWRQPNVPEGTRFVIELPIDGSSDSAA